MKHFRLLSVVMLSLLLASCGRQLPDTTPIPRPTNTPVADAVPEDDTAANETADTTEETTTAETDTTEDDATDETSDTAQTVDEEPADEMVTLVANANAGNGESLFNQSNSTGFACSNCHNPQNDVRLIGPGLWQIPHAAAERVEGQVAERYLYNSIVAPNDYIVEGDPAYPEGLMPQNYTEIYSDAEIHDIVAYLMTLTDTPVAVAQAGEQAVDEDAGADTEEADAEEVVDDEADADDTATEEVADDDAEDTDDTDTTDVDDAVAESTDPEPEYSDADLRTRRLLSVGEAEFGASLVESDDTIPDDLLEVAVNAVESNPDRPPSVAIYDAINDNEDYADWVAEQSFLDIANLIAYILDEESDETGDTTPADDEPVVVEATSDDEPDVVEESELSAEHQAIVDSVMSADADNGETLFNQMTSTGFACSNCHNANADVRLIGPGLLNIPTMAEDRVEGEPAIVYLYNSIVHPNDYIVEGDPAYPEGLMPQNYTDVFSEDEIFDLVAYLLTLDE